MGQLKVGKMDRLQACGSVARTDLWWVNSTGHSAADCLVQQTVERTVQISVGQTVQSKELMTVSMREETLAQLTVLSMAAQMAVRMDMMKGLQMVELWVCL